MPKFVELTSFKEHIFLANIPAKSSGGGRCFILEGLIRQISNPPPPPPNKLTNSRPFLASSSEILGGGGGGGGKVEGYSPRSALFRRSWSCEAGLSSGAILPFLTKSMHLYDQKTEKGQLFVQLSTLLYAFKPFPMMYVNFHQKSWISKTSFEKIILINRKSGGGVWSCYTGTDFLS